MPAMSSDSRRIQLPIPTPFSHRQERRLARSGGEKVNWATSALWGATMPRRYRWTGAAKSSEAPYVLSQNLVHGDALTMLMYDGQPITFPDRSQSHPSSRSSLELAVIKTW